MTAEQYAEKARFAMPPIPKLGKEARMDRAQFYATMAVYEALRELKAELANA